MNDIEEIKSRLNIVDVIQSYVKLEKAGINFRARCPFHNEKSPSFFVSPSRQLWHCFGGCNDGGDMFKFVMKIEGIDFPDALKLLAQKAGVQLKAPSPELQKMKTERQLLSDICEGSAKFFIAYLEKSKTGEKAKQYLLKRGLTEETIKSWRLGYAPDTWTSLADFLIGHGFKKENVVDAGVAISREGKFFDRFRSRIMFPIFDLNSQVIGFTGRIFGEKAGEETAKYLNTPNTLLYDKSRALYGMDKAKLEIRKQDYCVLVEGNVDCIMSHQAGIKNCIAVSGTALTAMHLNIIKRYSNNLVLAFDMDIAGNNATKKGIDLALKNGFNVKVIPMANEKDPADIVLTEGPDKWIEFVNSAKPINEFYFDLAFKNRNPESLEDKKTIVKELLPIFKEIENSIEQSYFIQKLSHALRISENDIRAEMKKINTEEVASKTEALEDNKEKKSRKQLLEEQILSIVLIDNSKLKDLLVEEFSFPVKDVLLQLKDNKALDIISSSSPDLANFLNYITLSSEIMKDSNIEINPEFESSLNELVSLNKKQERDMITNQIKELEDQGKFEEIKHLLEKFNNLTKK